MYENYHVSWLEIALENFKNDFTVIHTINSKITIGEFIEKYAKEELDKVVKLR